MSGLSIVICSRTKEINDLLRKNIREKAGCTNELIVIDNSENKLSIFQAYNKGIDQSKYQVIVFIHDDILFKTPQWGKIILKKFNEKPHLGLLGIAGSTQKSKFPSAWWDHPQKNLYLHILQHYPNQLSRIDSKGFTNENEVRQVVIIDGVFMALRRSTGARFNENLTGFHNYDQNISLEVIKNNYQVWVSNEISIEHFSLGKTDENWLESAMEISRIYKNQLPLGLDKITADDKAHTLLRLVGTCNSCKNYKLGFKYWLRYLSLKPFDKLNWFFFKYYMLKLGLYK